MHQWTANRNRNVTNETTNKQKNATRNTYAQTNSLIRMLQYHVVVDKDDQAKQKRCATGASNRANKKNGHVNWPSWGCALALRIPTKTSHCGCCRMQLHIRSRQYLKQMVWMKCNVRSGPAIDRGHFVTRDKHSGNIECRVHGSVGR